jgi:uncharacterized spore protein YtfJ
VLLSSGVELGGRSKEVDDMENTLDPDATVLEAIRRAVEDATVGTAFGTPISQDGLIVLPVAKVSGGGGGGINRGLARRGCEDAASTGGGLGVMAKPLGVYVIRKGKVRWRPAVDVNRVILGGQLVAVTALLTIRALAKARRSPAAAAAHAGGFAACARAMKACLRAGDTPDAD